MMGKSHLIISTGVTLSVLGIAGQQITVLVVAVTAISALLPDIDEPNSLIVSRALPTRFIRYVQLALIGLGVFLYFFGAAYTPWNAILAVLVGVVSFMPTRTLRNVMMVLIGAGLILYGHTFIPWNYIIGSLVILCALLPHRGLTHTVYGVVGWTVLLYFSTFGYDHTIWIAGGITVLAPLACRFLNQSWHSANSTFGMALKTEPNEHRYSSCTVCRKRIYITYHCSRLYRFLSLWYGIKIFEGI